MSGASDGNDKNAVWHERRRWIVAVAHPGTTIERASQIADWSDETLSRECLDGMRLDGVPLHIEHSVGQRHVAGRVVRDIQTPHDTDGRRIIVADCTLDNVAGGVASRMLDMNLLPEGSIKHEIEWEVAPDGTRTSARRIHNVEFSLVAKGLRDGCHVLGVYQTTPPTDQQVAELIERTRRRGPSSLSSSGASTRGLGDGGRAASMGATVAASAAASSRRDIKAAVAAAPTPGMSARARAALAVARVRVLTSNDRK